ncbi:PH domain-containing protein [Halogeometricum sp. S1BR25-6]|uniref:PH domain-containing protein n=1 Tax=Halogeometricum salsisoli TaxID=2950536 RepID=A0ABU2GKX9_9EURY|nr:PH domain-containing protein [Halogeometricum sp. S1BR25-6]MDS0300919.1 PH domain-containing protein [Halogeometricum sp. S1BR25-6]
MAQRTSRGLRWVGDNKALVYNAETNVSSGPFSASANKTAQSEYIRMDKERYLYEHKRIKKNRDFSADFSSDMYYRRIDGSNYSHPVEERKEFDRMYDKSVQIASQCPSATISIKKLADYKLHNPLVSYLEDKTPLMILHSAKKGISMGSELISPDEEIKPSRGLRCYTVLYDDHFEFILGKREDDRVETFSYEEITDVEVSTGLLKSRISVVLDTNTYHIWISRKYSSDQVKTAAKLFASKSPLEASQTNLHNKTISRSTNSDFDPSEYDTDNKWWLLARVALFIPIGLFMAFAAVSTIFPPPENAALWGGPVHTGLALLFSLSLPATPVLFAAGISGDKEYLVEETGHGTEWGPTAVLIFLCLTFGLYGAYYLLWRWKTYSN